MNPFKPLGFKNYGSIGHLSNSKLGEADSYVNPGQERILTIKKRDEHDEIIVTEKYDGSNVGIAKVNGKIIALTRKGYEATTSPYKMHHDFNDYVLANKNIFKEIINEGERLCGEWMQQPHGIKYNTKENPIIFFDLFNRKNKRKSFHKLTELCDAFSLPIVRALHVGESISTDIVKHELNKKTDWLYPPDEMPEGMVYRVERKGVFDFAAKWVRSDFVPGKYLDLQE